MDKEIKLIQKVKEQFPEEKISTLDVMERDKQMWRAVDLFEELKEKGQHDKVNKLGKFIYYQFGLDLSND